MTTPRKDHKLPPPGVLLWTEAEVAAVLRVPATTVERAWRAGVLRAVLIENQPRRYRPADIEAFVARLAGEVPQQPAAIRRLAGVKQRAR